MRKSGMRAVRDLVRCCVVAGLALAVTACPGSKPVGKQTTQQPRAATRTAQTGPRTALGPALSKPLPWKVTQFAAGPVRVVHKATPGRHVVAIRIYFDGGLAHLDPKTAGLEELTLATLERGGTKKYPRPVLAKMLAMRGIQTYSAAGPDYSVLAAKCTAGEFETAWDVITDLYLHPSFDETTFRVQRRRQLSMAVSQEDEPDDAVFLKLNEWYFAGHPYALRQTGTRENLLRFTIQDVRHYYERVLRRLPVLVVVSGDVDLDRVRRLAEKTFSSLPPPGHQPPLPPVPKRRGVRVQHIPRDLPTNYILGYFPAPRPGSQDWAAAEIAARWLSAQLFTELRTKRRLCYAVSVGLMSRKQNLGYLYLATRKPKEALRLALEIRDRLIRQGLDEATAQGLRSVAVTRYLMGIETQTGQAKNLARAVLTAGSWRWALSAPAELARVQPDQVVQVMRHYMTGIWFVSLGPDNLTSSDLTAVPSGQAPR